MPLLVIHFLLPEALQKASFHFTDEKTETEAQGDYVTAPG